MAAINEAWRVLSDPARRVRYDASLRGDAVLHARTGTSEPCGSSPSPPRMTEPRLDLLRRYVDPPRFPWRFVLGVIALGAAAILLVGAFVDPVEPAPVDNLLQAGSCVVLDEALDEAREVPCDAPHDAVVERLAPFDAVCPLETESYRDRQGMGQACVRRT